jgi:hypothetical protein
MIRDVHPASDLIFFLPILDPGSNAPDPAIDFWSLFFTGQDLVFCFLAGARQIRSVVSCWQDSISVSAPL